MRYAMSMLAIKEKTSASGKRIPYGVEADLREEIGAGKQQDQLAEKRDNQAGNAAAHSLEKRGESNAERGGDKAQADGAQSRYADGQHIGGSVENRKQLGRDQMEHHQPDRHDHDCDDTADTQGGEQAMLIAGAEIVSHDGHDALRQANTGMNTKDCSLKYTPKKATAVFPNVIRMAFMPMVMTEPMACITMEGAPTT